MYFLFCGILLTFFYYLFSVFLPSVRHSLHLSSIYIPLFPSLSWTLRMSFNPFPFITVFYLFSSVLFIFVCISQTLVFTFSSLSFAQHFLFLQPQNFHRFYILFLSSLQSSLHPPSPSLILSLFSQINLLKTSSIKKKIYYLSFLLLCPSFPLPLQAFTFTYFSFLSSWNISFSNI